MTPVLFVRVGSMIFYAGSQPGDEKPIGGGAYNRENLGHERYNFADFDGTLYGCFQPARGGALSLYRVEPSAKNQVDNVLIVFVAEQRIVGWYRNARLYDKSRSLPPQQSRRRADCEYLCEAPTKECTLLPTEARTFEIPRGRGGMGQANVTYALDSKGQPLKFPWVAAAIHFINDYQGANLLTDPLEEANVDLDLAIQRVMAAHRGQRFQSDPKIRKAVENCAVDAAKKYFEGLEYEVEVRGKPFDLKCTKGPECIFVEVKGSQNPCKEVSLTPNEVGFARSRGKAMALFVVHSIIVDPKKCTAKGGTSLLFFPWNPDDQNLTPAAWVYTLPKNAEVV